MLYVLYINIKSLPLMWLWCTCSKMPQRWGQPLSPVMPSSLHMTTSSRRLLAAGDHFPSPSGRILGWLAPMCGEAWERTGQLEREAIAHLWGRLGILLQFCHTDQQSFQFPSSSSWWTWVVTCKQWCNIFSTNIFFKTKAVPMDILLFALYLTYI